jgi:hypothetical protein
MSEPEEFLKRWSRRKRQAEEAGTREAAIKPPRDEQVEAEQGAKPVPQDDGTVANKCRFDPANLPSVDSIGSDTDIRDFLRPGVPPELTREALRRAWSSDPLIRDYIGPVENGWDFNDPDAILGFGTIKAEDTPRLLARVFEVSIDEKSEPSVLQKPATEQDSTATVTPEVAGPEAHTDAEPSPSDAKTGQGAAPSASGANAAASRTGRS